MLVPTIRRSTPLVLLASLTLLAASAHATTFSFGAAVFRPDLSVDASSGDSDDQASSQYSLATASVANFRAQASADTLVSDDAIADVSFVWDVPYTVTRNVTLSGCCTGAFEATFPLQVVYFGINFSGAAAVSQFGGDEVAEIVSGISVLSLGSWIAPVSLAGGSRSNSDGSTPVTGLAAADFLTAVDHAGPAASEVAFAPPADYRAWQDDLAPYALDYGTEQTVVQSFTDTLRVSFRLRAVSRPSGTISTTAGEAMACAGLQSTLDNFSLLPNCGSGLSIFGAVADFAEETVVVAVPEPGTLVLAALGAAGIGTGRRRRAAGRATAQEKTR
jgi:hypothetical protein